MTGLRLANRPYLAFQQSIDSGFSLLVAQRYMPFDADGEVDEPLSGLKKVCPPFHFLHFLETNRIISRKIGAEEEHRGRTDGQ